ncbi:hypothetical protein bthur0014_54150 [Bacillus thuringiensis IBL 4222]|nr:hypothetical protein bthur0010_58830 [Bacillus thuringiensis serovar pondicheriensis BGSC 4BA1]EEM99919.1 hypothetical protein bthur0014_54150 [Bacillus thuringiensis IBL 4222]
MEVQQERICSVDGCCGKVLAKKMCGKHYYQVRRKGKVVQLA